jgi:hypothetical protein
MLRRSFDGASMGSRRGFEGNKGFFVLGLDSGEARIAATPMPEAFFSPG